MRVFYRNHRIEVEPRGEEILFDVYDSRQHLLSGFSRTDIGEQTILERMKARVDKFITEAPVAQYKQ